MPLKYLTPEHQEKLLSAVRGVPKSPEHREKISAAQRGRKKSPEQIERLRQVHLGSKRTPEQKKAMSDARKGIPRGPYPAERGNAISKALTGRTPLLNKYGIDSDEYARQVVVAGNQWCSHKKHFAPADGFQSRSTACGSCAPEYHRMTNLRRNFGVDQYWYDRKLIEQGGVCAVCGTNRIENKGHRFFCVDHDHATGNVRGLLCSRCNISMERLDACANWCMRAMAYLEHYIKNPGPQGKRGRTSAPYKRRGKGLKPMDTPIVPPLPVPETTETPDATVYNHTKE